MAQIKFKVKNFNTIIDRLRLIGAKREWAGKEEIFYYDTFNRDLKKENKVLRFRREPTGKNILALKTANNLKFKNQNIVTENFKSAHNILYRMGFTPVFHCLIFRQYWKIGGICLALDTLDDGKFIEIETSKKNIDQLATILSLNLGSGISESYITLSQKQLQ